MTQFISCDWGTSALRLRLVNATDSKVLAEVLSPSGVSGTYDLWKKSGMNEQQRLFFYQSILNQHIATLKEQAGISLENVPLIISGMASSSIGMMELPYQEIPFRIDASGLKVKIITPAAGFTHTTLLIPGIRSENDVMRGEETQLIGFDNYEEDAVFIFPGTHSKHVMVKNGCLVDFKTFMTGEFFELLVRHSILSDSVAETAGNLNGNELKSFEAGLADGVHLNLLHSSFLVRTNGLFNKFSKKENYHYLSGVLIGSEIKELVNIQMPAIIIGNNDMIQRYTIALQKMGLKEIKNCNAGTAVINGHYKFFKSHLSNFNQ